MPKSTVTVSDIFTNMTCCVVNRADRFHEWQTEVAVKNNNVSYERPPKKKQYRQSIDDQRTDRITRQL